MSESTPDENTTEAVPGGAYEILRKRLDTQNRELGKRLAALNQKRVETFGSTEMAVIGRTRIRTENNCVPRDILDVGEHLLFGFNVFVGMRPEVQVEDVLSLHKIVEEDGELELPEIPLSECFLGNARFNDDFHELYRYYKEAHLALLRNVTGKKLAVFQTGRTLADARVFRWEFGADGEMKYIDNRGERDNVYPPSHDFQWTGTTRDDHITGVHPHISILGQVFVETIKGDLTIKIENNTESGEGIYAEAVEDPNQSLADAQIQYAKVGILILLKIRPYRENAWRYLIFNTRTKDVKRIDAIGKACITLPEDHGIMFPGGYYLQNGDTKQFEGEGIEDMEYRNHRRAPNGEDVLYIFHDAEQGRMALFSYNLIRREVQNPILCHGFSIFGDGRMVVFRAESEEPMRVHPMQIWQTPYLDDVHAAQAPTDGSYLAKVGNADLVRGISEAYSIKRLLDDAKPRMHTYETLIGNARRLLDTFHWLNHAETGQLDGLFHEILKNAELIIDEFEKVETLRRQAEESLREAERIQKQLFLDMRPERWTAVQEFVEHLSALRKQRGVLITLREVRYMDLARIDELEQAVITQFETISQATVDFLLDEKSLAPYHTDLDAEISSIGALQQSNEADAVAEKLNKTGDGLDLLNEVLGELQIADAQARTRILEGIAEVYAKLNRARAELQLRRKELRSGEAVAEFGAQFKLFAQNVSGAMNLADTPEKADEQLSRLMTQLEDMEGRFSEFDEFLVQIADKREEVYTGFETRKQQLLEQRQRRALHLSQAADRILQTVQRRASQLADADAQNAYFASDSMVLKVRDLVAKLYELGDSVKAGDLEGRLKSLRDQAGRELRDREEIFSEGGAVIKLGKHRFSVNTQELDLSLVPYRKDDEPRLAVHLSGTDFFEIIDDPELDAMRPYWEQSLASENERVYRAEFLVSALLDSAKQDPARLDELRQAALAGNLLDEVRAFAAERYDEGYERGVHDHDASLILAQLLELEAKAGLLRFSPAARALGQWFWAFHPDREACTRWQASAQSLAKLKEMFGGGWQAFQSQLETELTEALDSYQLSVISCQAKDAAAYLLAELELGGREFTVSGEAMQLAQGFLQHLDEHGGRSQFEQDLSALRGESRLALTQAWLQGYAAEAGDYGVEAAVIVVTESL